MMMNNAKEFENEVVELLKKIKKDDEFFVRQLRGYDLYSETGIEKLGIPKDSFIEIKYISEDNLSAFKKIIFPKRMVGFSLRDISLDKTVFICNLTSNAINRLCARLSIGNKLLIISVDDLRNAELSLFDAKSHEQNSDNKSFPVFNKSISFDQLDDFLLSLIRVNILVYAFPNGSVNMSRMIAQSDELLPFSYEDESKRIHVFINDKSRYSRRSVLFSENAIVHKVGYTQLPEKTIMSIDGKEFEFDKITRRWFNKHIPFFNSYSRFEAIPKKAQYKYRRFGKFSFLDFDEKTVDVYAKKVIEGKEIYFSTKDQLNDPFDLDADGFGPRVLLTSANYRIFCTTGDCDNLLMWSHYGDSHSGFCTSYQPISIMNAIENSKKIDFCIHGYVHYCKDRKDTYKHLLLLYAFFDSDTISLILQIIQLFKKYNDWSYEKEYRYIVCSLTPLIKTKTDGLPAIKEVGLALIVNPSDYFFGNKFQFNAKIKTYLRKYIGNYCYSFILSKDKYELIKVKEDLF